MELGDEGGGGGGGENDLLVLVQHLFASKYFSASYSLPPSTIESSHFSWSIFFAQFLYWNFFFSSSNHLPLKISKR